MQYLTVKYNKIKLKQRGVEIFLSGTGRKCEEKINLIHKKTEKTRH